MVVMDKNLDRKTIVSSTQLSLHEVSFPRKLK